MKPIDSKAGDKKDVRLRERLRAGDPASGVAPLATEEVQAMRRAMLGAVPESRPVAPWRLPAFAMAGLVLVATLGFALYAWLSGGAVSPSVRGEAGPVVAEGAPPVEPGEAARGTGPGEAALPGGEGSTPHASLPGTGANSDLDGAGGGERSPRPTSSRPALAPSVRSASAPRLASAGPSAPDAEAASTSALREIQFSTPGGTRIVWVFASGDSPTSETPRPTRL